MTIRRLILVGFAALCYVTGFLSLVGCTVTDAPTGPTLGRLTILRASLPRGPVGDIALPAPVVPAPCAGGAR